MNQTAAILLMYLMFGQFMILMCGAFLLWWMGDFGRAKTRFNNGQTGGRAEKAKADAHKGTGKSATDNREWLVPLAEDHSIAPRVAAELSIAPCAPADELKHDNDVAPARDQAVGA